MLTKTSLNPVLAAGSYPAQPVYDADIIILTLNRFAETLEAVSSALRQTGLSFHVSVLDQGSDPAVRADYATAFSGRDNLGYFTIDENLGVAGGRNRLAMLGTGRVIIALDNDAVFADTTTAMRAAQAFDYKPRLGALGFKILSRDAVHLDDASWGYPAALKKHADERFSATTFVGAGHAIRRRTWTQAGGYDEGFFFTWEEYDFCLTAIALDWLVEYDGSLAVIHKSAAEGRIGHGEGRVEYAIRNRLVIARKWGASWLGLLPRITGYAVRGWLNHCFIQVLTGIRAALQADAGLPRRAMTPAMRRYIERHETRYRGALLQRLRREVFVKMR